MALSLNLVICLLFMTSAKAAETVLTTNATEPTVNATEPTTNATEPTTTPLPDPCTSKPCEGGSSCEGRANQTFECICAAGYLYDYSSKQCVLAKVFPADLFYNKIPYESSMSNKKSEAFKRASDEIVEAMATIMENSTDYLSSTVTKLSSPVSKKTTGVTAAVEMMFDKDSTVTKKDITEQVKTAGGSVGIAQFTTKPLCGNNKCDTSTAECKDNDEAFTCECKPGFIRTNFSERICVACPKNEKEVKGACEGCDFGYSGFNCEDAWQLNLVIVGSVLGALLLIMIILLPVVAVTSKKKSKKEKSNEYAKPYPTHAATKPPQISSGLGVGRPSPAPPKGLTGFGGVPQIPRATANENWERKTNLEMVQSNSRQNLIPAGRNSRRFDDHDDGNPYSRPMRPQVNPYASSQGHSNPYYRN